jgi:primosomal protein N' (replication factor Y)
MRVDVLVLGKVARPRGPHPLYPYSVPPALAARVRPGQLVAAPFGSRLLAGIVWSVGEEDRAGADGDTAAPLSATLARPSEHGGQGGENGRILRALVAVLDPEPLLRAHQRALAEWLVDRYACGLDAAARLMLPPGLVRNTRVVLRPTAAPAADAHEIPGADAVAPSARSPGREAHVAPGRPDSDHLGRDDGGVAGSGPLSDDTAVLGVLRARGRLDERALGDVLGPRRARAAVAALVESGAAEREAVLPAVLGGRRETFARLTGDAAGLAEWRASARAELDTLPRSRAGASTVPGRRGHAAVRPPARAHGREELRAERLLRQLAVLDLLGRQRADAGRDARVDMSLGWRLPEVRRLTRVTPAALAELERAGLVAIETAETWRDPLRGRAVPPNPALPLTAAQAAALAAILAPGEGGESPVILLHGVTGSGKTEVYLQALAAHIATGQRGIVLVPEIALTPQAMLRFAGRFPGRVALLHSGLTDAERLDEWRRIRAGLVDVVVGSRSALFAPVDRLGLVVVDEEHEAAYKQEERAPTYHAREAAIALGRLTGATVVLGSATPSVESFWRAGEGTYRLVTLTERAPAADGGMPAALPPVRVVDLRAELRAGNTSILGEALRVALAETLASGQQAVLFLNRRGMASCVICRDCGYVALCGRCDVPMTYHAGEGALICHYCGRRQAPPRICPHCWGASIRYFGLGTERVEAAVRRLHPGARVLRWDRDTARTRQAHEELLAAFAERRADVLVGTQMIAKGLDLPAVTLVGVVSADVALYLPDFRAPERAFQLLTQVAGRAGRGGAAGRVIIQTFSPEHFCIQAAAGHDYERFYAAEISARERYGYPPFRQLVKFTYTDADRHRTQGEAFALANRVDELIHDLGLPDTDVVGPAPAFMERLRGRYRWHLIARGPDLRPLLHALGADDLPWGWSVDVDPQSTL